MVLTVVLAYSKTTNRFHNRAGNVPCQLSGKPFFERRNLPIDLGTVMPNISPLCCVNSFVARLNCQKSMVRPGLAHMFRSLHNGCGSMMEFLQGKD